MDLIYGWVMQIIIFILIATILELLIPNNAMKKYINIVIGLLLLLILSQPILYIFSIDVTAELERVERTIFQDDNTLLKTTNILENEKKEIQATSDAYIWNEVKLQLEKEANPVLLEQYSIRIVNLTFTFDDRDVDNDDNLKEVIVTLTTNESDEPEEKSEVDPIIIGSEQKLEPQPKMDNQSTEIKKTLEQVWGVKQNQIQIIWEGVAS